MVLNNMKPREQLRAMHFLSLGEPQLSLALSLNAADFIFACTLQVMSTKTATIERGTKHTRCTRHRKEGWWEPVGREWRCHTARL